MKILSASAHGVLDYVTVVLFALAPTLFGLTGLAATLAYVLAAVHLLLTLITAFPLGVVKIVPFHLHGHVELVVSIALALLGAFYFGLEGINGIFYLAIGIVIFLIWLLTAYGPAKHAH
jgi:hypothetical protein